jgi:hypothetical protein
VPNVEFHFGNFLTRTKKRPLAAVPTRFVEILDTKEKGSDVNLADFESDAQRLECDEDKGRFEGKLGKIAGANVTSRKSPGRA